VRRADNARRKWSAGRRSARAAGLANLPHAARAPRGGIRNPVPYPARGRPDRKGGPKGAVAQRPGASRRSIPSLCEGRKKGQRRTRRRKEYGRWRLAV